MSGSLEQAEVSPKLRHTLAALGVAMAHRDRERIHTRLRELHALTEAAGPAEAVEEAILQTLLFLGFPAALTTLAAWREISGRAPSGSEPSVSAGEAVCHAVYGSAYPLLRERMGALHPAADRWMVEDGYGKVMGRAGLDLPSRELLNVALLAATDYPEQLHSHLRGALEVGAAVEEIEEILRMACSVLLPDRRAALLSLWSKIARRHRERITEF